MDEAKGEERHPRRLTNQMLIINFAAIHTSSAVSDIVTTSAFNHKLQTFTHTLFELASRPEYLPALREEVEAAVEMYGWTKMALVHMHKLDSLFKESQRYNGITLSNVIFPPSRKVQLVDQRQCP